MCKISLYRKLYRKWIYNGANEPLLSSVVSESCFVIRDNPECCASRMKIKRSKCRCAYYSNSTATFQCLLQGDLVFKLNPSPTGAQSTIYAHCSVTCRRVPLSPRTRNHSNLNTVKRAPTTNHFNTPILKQQDNRAFQLCSLNARSLRNKSTAFVDLVCDLRAELFTICESWLHDLDSAILSELTLPGYSKLYHCPRTDRRGGGTAPLYRDALDVNKVFSAERSSFEVSEWLVVFGFVRLRAVIVYRPTYSAEHPVTTSVFFHEFSVYLESLVTCNELLLICGDFNIDMDVPSDADTIRLKDLLNSMGLVQHVKRPTHIHGHTLDLIITRQADDIVDGEPLPERYFSDHAAVICNLSVAKPPLRIKHAEYRKLKSIDVTRLKEDVCNSQLYQDPPNDLNMLLDRHNTTLRSLLDDHASVCYRHVSTRPRPSWFNEDIIQARRDRRQAERRWRASGLQEDLVVFKAKRNYVIHLMNEARCTYYKEFIDENSSNQSKLFRASKSPLNLNNNNNNLYFLR